MQFSMSVNMDNAAFGEDDEYERANELRRILGKLGEKLMTDTTVAPGVSGQLLDYNGNAVGWWEIIA